MFLERLVIRIRKIASRRKLGKLLHHPDQLRWDPAPAAAATTPHRTDRKSPCPRPCPAPARSPLAPSIQASEPTSATPTASHSWKPFYGSKPVCFYGIDLWVDPEDNDRVRAQKVIDKSGRVVIPKSLRKELHLEAGDTLELESAGQQIIFRPVRGTGPLNKEHGVWGLPRRASSRLLRH